MNWLVTWIVFTMSLSACPPSTWNDPYLGEITTPNTTLMACYTSDTKQMERYFNTHEEAVEFVKNAAPMCEEGEESGTLGFGETSCVRDFKITHVSRE
jgi:hypothetical protein